jgi:glutamyl-tRNA reductase
LEKVLSRLKNLSAHERAAIDGLTAAVVNKLLHGSLVTLKTEAQSPSGTLFVEAARRFFNLEQTPDTPPDNGEETDPLLADLGMEQGLVRELSEPPQSAKSEPTR